MPVPIRIGGGSIIICGEIVYPTPGFVIFIVLIFCADPIPDSAVAVSPAPTFPIILTLGEVEYPTPPSVILIDTIPKLFFSIVQVAAAPTPFPLMVIIGGTVYPAPALIREIFLIE